MKEILKTSLFVFISILTTNLFGQTPDSLGMDDKPVLNRQESTLLSSFQKNSKDSFDFTGKKIAFVTGSTGGRVIAKSYYFGAVIGPWVDKGASPQFILIRLTEEEKLKSGGYDAIVLSWVKMFTDKQRRKVITRLQSGTSEG